MSDDGCNSVVPAQEMPESDATWGQIGEFVLLFDAYGHWGSFDRCADIANVSRQPHESLVHLRTRLFFEQRRWRHFGEEPHPKAMQNIRDLFLEIRNRMLELE